MKEFRFPEDFLFGTSTASYQIEGYPLADGASPSIWHDFSHLPGKTEGGDTGDIACDHYHRYAEDVGIMKEIGCNTYRFSAAWPRIVPEPGRVNPKGIGFYDRLVDELLSREIEPLLTLFHWDAPRWFEEMGGFTTKDTLDHFTFYCETLFRALGDRVKKWVTVNEPMVFAVNGYHTGEFPPGRKFDLKGMFRATHYLLLAHAKTVRRFRRIVPDGSIGIAQAQVWMAPLRPENERDIKAAKRMDAVANRMYMDPLYFGSYPEEVLSAAGKRLPGDYEADLQIMKEPGDFVGINYYMRRSYRASLFIPLVHAQLVPTPGAEESAMWEVFPEGLYNLLLRLKEEYGNPPCYITENGYPLVEEEGEPLIEDTPRIEYLRRHLEAAARAIQAGVDLRGYYLWSLMDNFEWNLGNRMRFGIVRTDFETLERTWKKSAYWYRDLISRKEL